MNEEIYNMVFLSLQRICAEHAEQMAMLHNREVQPVYLDAHADDSTIPEVDIVTLGGISLIEDTGLVTVSALFGVSTLSDTNLHRMGLMFSNLFQKMLTGKTFPIWRSDALQKGRFTVREGSRALPVGGAGARPLQQVAVTMVTDQLVIRQP